jgi:hypothetical protein
MVGLAWPDMIGLRPDLDQDRPNCSSIGPVVSASDRQNQFLAAKRFASEFVSVKFASMKITLVNVNAESAKLLRQQESVTF